MASLTPPKGRLVFSGFPAVVTELHGPAVLSSTPPPALPPQKPPGAAAPSPPPPAAAGLASQLAAAFQHPLVQLGRRLSSYAFSFVAIYFIYKNALLLTEDYRGASPFFTSATAAEDASTCVPLFEKVAAALNSSSSVLWAYRQSTPLVRVCTDLGAHELDAALGYNYRYDPLALLSACNSSSAGFAGLAAACTFDGKGAPSPPYAANCSAVAAACAAGAPAGAPAASSCFFRYGAAAAGSGPCSGQVYPLMAAAGAAPPACNKRYVWSLLYVSSIKQGVTYLALAAMAVRLLCEVVATVQYCRRGSRAPAEEAPFCERFFWGFVVGGLLGAPLEAYNWSVNGEPFPLFHGGRTVATAVLFSDMCSHVAIPAVQVAGCYARAEFVLPFIQIIFQCVKALYRFVVNATRELELEKHRKAAAAAEAAAIYPPLHSAPRTAL